MVERKVSRGQEKGWEQSGGRRKTRTKAIGDNLLLYFDLLIREKGESRLRRSWPQISLTADHGQNFPPTRGFTPKEDNPWRPHTRESFALPWKAKSCHHRVSGFVPPAFKEPAGRTVIHKAQGCNSSAASHPTTGVETVVGSSVMHDDKGVPCPWNRHTVE